MVLSNAERQKRYRERLKAAARGDDLGGRVRAVLDAAFQAAWAIYKRDDIAPIEEWSDWEAMRRDFAGGPPHELRSLFDLVEDANGEREAAPLRAALAAIDAVLLRHVEPRKKAKR